MTPNACVIQYCFYRDSSETVIRLETSRRKGRRSRRRRRQRRRRSRRCNSTKTQNAGGERDGKKLVTERARKDPNRQTDPFPWWSLFVTQQWCSSGAAGAVRDYAEPRHCAVRAAAAARLHHSYCVPPDWVSWHNTLNILL